MPYAPLFLPYLIVAGLGLLIPITIIVQLGIIASRLREIIRRLPPPPRR